MEQSGIDTSIEPEAQSGNTPLISFVVCGRNDNYMGNYTWRITTAMNCLVRNLVRVGRQNDAEIILADWNSDIPFHKEMLMVPEARGIMRFMVVPPAVAVPAQKDSSFPNPIAQNAAIRRSRGRFVAVSDADVILPASSLATLFAILEGKLPIGLPLDRAFLIAARRQLPTARTEHNPPLPEIEAFLDRNLALLKRDLMMGSFGAPAGLVLLHRDRWEETRGYDERLIHHGWGDIDLHLRLCQVYPWVDLANFGVETVHLEHYAGSMVRGATKPRKYNGHPVSRRMTHNDENWGMANVDLSMHDPEAVMDEAAVARITAAAATARCPNIPLSTIVSEIQQTALTVPHEQIDRLLKIFVHAQDEYAALRMLAWYAIHRHPRVYVELGVQKSSGPGVVLLGCPTCEVYGVDQWSEDHGGGEPPSYRFAQLIDTAAAQAQAHLVTADPATALDRLFGRIAPHLAVDLALLRTDPLFGDPVHNVKLLAQRLAPGGAIVLSARTPAEFTPVWTELSSRLPQSANVLSKNAAGEVQIGMLLTVG